MGILWDRLLICDLILSVNGAISGYIHALRDPITSILMGPFEVFGWDFKIGLEAVAESESKSRRGTLRLMDVDASYSGSVAAVWRMAVNPLEVSGSERREYKIAMVVPRVLEVL